MIYQGKKGAEQVLANLRRRAEGDLSEVETRVKEILADVQARGDQALAEYALKFDDTDYHKTPLIVGEEEIQQAYAQVDEKTLAELQNSKRVAALEQEKHGDDAAPAAITMSGVQHA